MAKLLRKHVENIGVRIRPAELLVVSLSHSQVCCEDKAQ